MSFPPDTKMFQFSGFAPTHYVFMCRSGLSQGLPHSEIAGSKPIRGSPTLIAAYHVLHRLSVPRHPPNALKSLDRSHYQCSSGLLDLGKEIQLMNIDAEKLICASICLLWAVKHHSRGSRHYKQIPSFTMSISDTHACYCGETGYRSPAGCRISIMEHWWSQTGSNRRPQACKASALPTELWPRSVPCHQNMVGLGRLELPTPRLSSVCSNQLSYRPEIYRPQSIMRPERKRNVDGGVPQMNRDFRFYDPMTLR